MEVKEKRKERMLQKWTYESRVERCERKVVVLNCKECGQRYVALLHCGYRTCLICAKMRSERLFSDILEIVNGLPITRERYLQHLVLTWGTEGFLSYRVLRIWEEFFKVWRNLLKTKYSGALVCLEVGGFNGSVHLHILYYGSYVSKKRLRREWYKHTGKFEVSRSRVNGRDKGVIREVAKYTVKGVGGNPDVMFVIERALHKTRRIRRFGVFRNAEVSRERIKCPICGCHRWKFEACLDVREDLADIVEISMMWLTLGGCSARGSPLSKGDLRKLYLWISLRPMDVVKVLKGRWNVIKITELINSAYGVSIGNGG